MTSQLAALGRAIVLANLTACFRLLVSSLDLDGKPSPTGTDLHYLMIMLLVLIPQYHHLLILYQPSSETRYYSLLDVAHTAPELCRLFRCSNSRIGERIYKLINRDYIYPKKKRTFTSAWQQRESP